MKKRDFGDFIGHQTLLSHKSNCWVKYNMNGRCFIEDGYVFAFMVCDDGCINNGTYINNSLQIYCISPVFRIISMYGRVEIFSGLYIYDKVKIYCNSKVSGNKHVDRYVCVYSNAKIYNYAGIIEYPKIYVNVLIRCYVKFPGKAKAYGYAEVCGCEDFCNEKEIRIGSRILYGTKEVRKRMQERRLLSSSRC
ncbi:hypothetical protein [Bartonella callosciuri]|uniref:hypothetical protein n=1 Tax=Bartonella callosciuri TaxID=686223 RepID=UPI001AED2F94|nr:hypothetical protein [Bartonella callosciuri]